MVHVVFLYTKCTWFDEMVVKVGKIKEKSVVFC